ncbi:MAG: T9SS type A sorting domain-containing protein [Bacteroidia bacterium]|nr:T9SS type A sorting domain-containing protein [Bacteroidia bacterium]
MQNFLLLFLLVMTSSTFSQLPVGYDTLTVFENNKVLYSSACGGINYSNIYKGDINDDGKSDIILYDRMHFFNYGEVKCFLNFGNAGETKYRYDYYLSKSFPKLVNWAIFKDFNHDGKIDIFTSTTGGIKVYKNMSNGVSFSMQIFKPIIYSNYNPTGNALYAPVYASSVGLPAIDDIDNDGDLDLLTFNSTGFSVEYHLNKSMEWYGHSDSLIFELQDNCWGNFSEGNCSATLNNCANKMANNSNGTEYLEKVYHSGSCITCIDINHNHVKDLLLGDVSCNNILFLFNSGNSTNAIISDTTKLFPNYPGKNTSQQIKINNFPCAYYDDFDNDGKKDIVASPNLSAGENYNCLWFYKNVGVSKDSFVLIKKNFLVDNTVDVGDGALPLVIDIDMDGKKDLLIGNLGIYNYFLPNSNVATISYYKNIGTISVPQFSLITKDFLNLSSLNKLNLSPTAGDIDGDGDMDIILGDSYGKLHWLENTAGAGFPSNFSVVHQNIFGITVNSPPAYPFLFDVNDDGKLDLIIGNKQNKIAYYQNVGTFTNPSFTLITNNFGNVNTNLNPIYYAGDGGTVPFMYKENNKKYLLCGSINGNLFLYDQIENNYTGSFRVLDTMVNGMKAGIRSAPQYIDINGDGIRDLIVGNYAGGIYYFSSKAVYASEDAITTDKIQVFPNPVNAWLYIRFDNIFYSLHHIKFTLKDITGKDFNFSLQKSGDYQWMIDMGSLSEGIYFLEIILDENKFTFKILKQ